MQSGVFRGHIRNEFITHHSTLSNHRPERILAHPARFLPFISHTDLTDLTDFFRCKQRYSLCLTGKKSEGVEIREIRGIRVGKLNTNH